MTQTTSTNRERAAWGSITLISGNKFRLRVPGDAGNRRSAGVFDSWSAAEDARIRLYVEARYGLQISMDGTFSRRQPEGLSKDDEGSLRPSMTVQEWVDHLEPMRRLKLSSDSFPREQSRLHKWILPKWGKWRLEDIDRDDVDQWWADLEEQTTPVNRRNIYFTLSAYMRAAARRRPEALIRENPCQVEGASKNVSRPRPRHRPEDLLRILELLPEHLVVLVVLSSNVHLRPGEARGLNKGDYNRETREVTIQRRATNAGPRGIAGPKRQSVRVVGVSEDVFPLLEAHLDTAPGDANAPMFPGLIAARMSPEYIRKHWQRAVEAAGLDAAAWHLHDLRGIGLTEMNEKGVPEKDLMRRSGHRSRSALAPYLHTDASRDAEVTTKYAGWLGILRATWMPSV